MELRRLILIVKIYLIYKILAFYYIRFMLKWLLLKKRKVDG